jgi:hypothetical protein
VILELIIGEQAELANHQNLPLSFCLLDEMPKKLITQIINKELFSTL